MTPITLGAHPKDCFIQGAHLDSQVVSTLPYTTSLSQAYTVLKGQRGREPAGKLIPPNPTTPAHWRSPTSAPRVAWEGPWLSQELPLPTTARGTGIQRAPVHTCMFTLSRQPTPESSLRSWPSRGLQHHSRGTPFLKALFSELLSPPSSAYPSPAS